ncbi:MAG TPA: MFS transporter [Pyrinomonadaceae bacterium]|jgi:MFS family permease|nr:MFS transporter [Pyrinomonadaceae bacterium]
MLLDISPLKISRDYRLLFSGQLISSFGTAMTFVIVPVQVYQLTGSTLYVGLLSVAEFALILLMAFVGGAYADFIDKRRMLRLTEIGQTLVTVMLVANALAPRPRVWVLFACAALHAGLAALQRPSFEALMQKLVPPELMASVSALNSLRWNVTTILGPSLAGIILARFGAQVAYLIDLSTFIASLSAVFLIRAVPKAVQTEARPTLKSVVEGVHYAWRRKELLGTYLIDMNAMFFGMPTALFPAMAAHFGAGTVGFFYAAPSVGALLATLTSGWTKNVHRQGLFVALAAGLWGVAIIFFGLAQNLYLALTCLALAGGFDMISAVFRMTMWNQTIPHHLRGRLAGMEMISYTSGPKLGDAEAGLVAALFSVRTSIVSGGILCVAGTAIISALIPQFLHYDGREGIRQRELEEALRETETKNLLLE